MSTNVPRNLVLDLLKHVMRNASRLRLCVHFESWGSSVAWRWFSLWVEETFLLFVYTFFFQQPNPLCCNRSTTNLFIISFLSRTIDFSFPFWAYGFIYGWPRPVSSRSAKQPDWGSTPIVTIVSLNGCWIQSKNCTASSRETICSRIIGLLWIQEYPSLLIWGVRVGVICYPFPEWSHHGTYTLGLDLQHSARCSAAQSLAGRRRTHSNPTWPCSYIAFNVQAELRRIRTTE